MKKALLFILISFNFEFLALAQNYANPIISGYNPDPSICRVKDDYYLVTSSFEYFPGVPIYHSKDLVNWKIIGYALHRPSQLQLDSVNCSGGIFAPTIRYNNGVFYMITTLVDNTGKNKLKKGNFVVTATNPKGPWSDPHWLENAPGIDPSLLFDEDGKVYYVGCARPKNGIKVWKSHYNIWVQELDINTWKLVGEKTEVLDGSEYYQKGTLDGGIQNGVNNFEGPHLYKKNGTYYLLIAHGGTGTEHAVSMWKSKSIFGPYEINPKNPILTNRDFPNDTSLNATGHADLVQTQNGDWWVVYLGKRPDRADKIRNFTLGRETFMSPVDWSGDFPVVNPNASSKEKMGHGELTHPKPKLKEFKYEITSKDDFNDTILPLEYNFIRTPRIKWWSINAAKGQLQIKLRPEKLSDMANPSFIGKRIKGKNFICSTKLSTNLNTNEEAGIAMIKDTCHVLRFIVSKENDQLVLKVGKKAPEKIMDETLANVVLEASEIYLKIEMNRFFYTFNYSIDNKNWKTLIANVDGSFLGQGPPSPFTGSMIGMYASSNGQLSQNTVSFDWFELK